MFEEPEKDNHLYSTTIVDYTHEHGPVEYKYEQTPEEWLKCVENLIHNPLPNRIQSIQIIELIDKTYSNTGDKQLITFKEKILSKINEKKLSGIISKKIKRV